MVKVKNVNGARGETYEEGGSRRGGRSGKGKGKKVANEVGLPERFISVKEAANFEEWTKKKERLLQGTELIYLIWKVIQYFLLNLVGISDHISIWKIYSKHTFKRMGFSGNEEDDESDEEEEEEDDEGQDAMNVDEEVSEEEPEEETFKREIRQKKRQERVEEGQSPGGMSQLIEIMASMQASINYLFDALDGKISDIQEKVVRLEARGKEENR
ncbi:hypothetical protein M9H77_17436 [Catharanthus roseus]|uniref:Uncharacterized protein n=1 Tax=Catharanthus roseus TaxID=4058 RepID=A0ACC0B4Y7_CATRO|nr:hypothetical protein M9H77_17436 [Catharanthus roseus]